MSKVKCSTVSLPGGSRSKKGGRGKAKPRATASVAAVSFNPEDLEPEIVTRVRSLKSPHKTERVKLSSSPGYLRGEWLQVHARYPDLPIGLTLTLFILQGLKELGATEQAREWRRVVADVNRADHRMLTLKARTALLRYIGTMQRPGFAFAARLPEGDVEQLQFRAPKPYAATLTRLAHDYGMSKSQLGIVALGFGMYHVLRAAGEDILDPRTSAAVTSDFDDLVEKIGERAAELEELFTFYRGNR